MMDLDRCLSFLPQQHRSHSAALLRASMEPPGKWLLARLDEQGIHLRLGPSEELASYAISSARKGTGNLLDSERTPIGLHRVCERIGDGLAPGALLRGRVPTGEISSGASAPGDGDEPPITSRILRLRGLNPGLNLGRDGQGRCVDSHERYIYIHGTSRSFARGERSSRGCLSLADADAIELYGQTPLGCLLLIIDCE